MSTRIYRRPERGETFTIRLRGEHYSELVFLLEWAIARAESRTDWPKTRIRRMKTIANKLSECEADK